MQKPLPALLLRAFGPLLMLILWLLSSQSTLPAPKNIAGFDKIAHFIAYALLAFLLGFWIRPQVWLARPLRSCLLCASIASLYGIIDEVHQSFVPGRDACIFDWFADTTGAFFGAVMVYCFFKTLEKASGPKAGIS